MADSSIWPVQVAIYNLLVSDATLVAMLATWTDSAGVSHPAIFDAIPPQSQPYPYILLGANVSENPEYTFSAPSIWDQDYQVDIYTEEQGKQQVAAILTRVNRNLNLATLDLSSSGMGNLGVFIETPAQIMPDEDDVHMHALIHYHILSQ